MILRILGRSEEDDDDEEEEEEEYEEEEEDEEEDEEDKNKEVAIKDKGDSGADGLQIQSISTSAYIFFEPVTISACLMKSWKHYFIKSECIFFEKNTCVFFL